MFMSVHQNGFYLVLFIIKRYIVQSAGAVEYTDSFFAEGLDSHHCNECPGYDTKQSDDEVSVMLEL